MQTFTFGNDSKGFTVRAVDCKKQALAHVVVAFKSSQDGLLNALLDNFVVDKVIGVGTGSSAHIESAVTRGTGAIYLRLPDKYIFNAIINLYTYLMRTKLQSVAVRAFADKPYSYKKLHDDIRKFSVNISGRCTLTLRKIVEKNPVCKRFETIILHMSPNTKAEESETPVLKVPPPSLVEKFEINSLSATARLYFTIFMMENWFHFDDSGKLYGCAGEHDWFERQLVMYAASANSRVKNFLQQAGKITLKPSKSDTGGVKMKERNSLIVATAKINVEMLNLLYKTNFRASDIDETFIMKVDSGAVKEVLDAMKLKKK